MQRAASDDLLWLCFDLGRGTEFDEHVHDVHQLSWTPTGVLRARIGHSRWSLPRTTALWIPAGTRHAVAATRQCSMVSAYIRPPRCPIEWPAPLALEVSAFVGELMTHLTDPRITGDRRARVEQVLFDNLRPAESAPGRIEVPRDPAARRVAEALLDDPADRRTLADWSRVVPASRATLARRFAQETGLTFAAWRTAVRVDAAMDHLADRRTVAAIARRVGYRDTSSFISAFKRATGQTPATLRHGSGPG